MSSLKLLIYAVTAEIASVMLLLSKQADLSIFLLYLLSHGLASALLSVVAWSLLPSRFRTPKILSWVLIFSFAFFIPAMGLVTILGGVALGIWLPALFREKPFGLVDQPYFTPVQVNSTAGFRQIDLKNLLTSSQAPNALRVL